MAERLINFRERKRQLIAETKQGRNLLRKEWKDLHAPRGFPLAGCDSLGVAKPVWIWVIPSVVGFQIASVLKRKTHLTVRRKKTERHPLLGTALRIVSDRFVPNPLARAALKALPLCWRMWGFFRRC